jgi:hypothetical protein
MLRKILVSAGIVLALTTATSAQVKLERKYADGASYTAETTGRVEQKLTIAGMDTETNSETRTTVKATIGKRDVGGMLRIEQKIEAMQISMAVQGQNYSFDSANPDNKGSSQLEILRDIHKALARRVSTTVLDKDNRVYAIQDGSTAAACRAANGLTRSVPGRSHALAVPRP